MAKNLPHIPSREEFEALRENWILPAGIEGLEPVELKEVSTTIVDTDKVNTREVAFISEASGKIYILQYADHPDIGVYSIMEDYPPEIYEGEAVQTTIYRIKESPEPIIIGK